MDARLGFRAWILPGLTDVARLASPTVLGNISCVRSSDLEPGRSGHRKNSLFCAISSKDCKRDNPKYNENQGINELELFAAPTMM